jgi:ABC-type Mn2+/Zn2+ transport system ATPase subunit
MAEELASDPYLMLVDEPVSGTDARDVSVVMNTLRELVNQNRTVIATLYQVHKMRLT